MSVRDMPDLLQSADAAFQQVAPRFGDFQSGYMVLSDLCGSTDVASRDLATGAALQAAHEAVCAKLSGNVVDSPHFKSLGDGVMIELPDALQACRIALQLIEVAHELRLRASRGQIRSEFDTFTLKVVVVSGRFLPAADTQRWLGLLPTKAAPRLIRAAGSGLDRLCGRRGDSLGTTGLECRGRP